MRGLAFRRSKGLIVATAIFIALVAAAIPYWTGGGSGTASATLDNPQVITLSAGTPSDEASPGETAEVAAVATNPNTYAVQIDSIALDTAQGTDGFDVDPGHAGCGVSSLDFTTQDNGGAGWTVPPRVGPTDGSLSINMTGALTMSAGASNACQGASFTVYLEVSF
jgi:hypothetical protein